LIVYKKKREKADGSPNSKSQQIHQEVDSFKKEIVTSELEEIRKFLNVPSNVEESKEYEALLNYVEEYVKDIREDEITLTYDEVQKDNIKFYEHLMDVDMMDEKQQIVSECNVLCPICEEALLEIEELTNPSDEKQILRIYNCICGAQFQCANSLLRNPQMDETSENHVKRLLSSVKERLNQVFFYHQQHNQCSQKLCFRVEPEKKYLQCWCNHCKFNDIVV